MSFISSSMFVFRVTLICPASITYIRDYANSTTFCIRQKISADRILRAPVRLSTRIIPPVTSVPREGDGWLGGEPLPFRVNGFRDHVKFGGLWRVQTLFALYLPFQRIACQLSRLRDSVLVASNSAVNASREKNHHHLAALPGGSRERSEGTVGGAHPLAFSMAKRIRSR